MVSINKTIYAGKDVEKRGLLYTDGGTINWYSCYRKHYGNSPKI